MTSKQPIKIVFDIVKSEHKVSNYGDVITHIMLLKRHSGTELIKTVQLGDQKFNIVWDGPYGSVNLDGKYINHCYKNKPDICFPSDYIIYTRNMFCDVDYVNRLGMLPFMIPAINIKPVQLNMLQDFIDNPGIYTVNTIDISKYKTFRLTINGIHIVNLTESLMLLYKKFVNPKYYITRVGSGPMYVCNISVRSEITINCELPKGKGFEMHRKIAEASKHILQGVKPENKHIKE
jgi:hypothetical protein